MEFEKRHRAYFITSITGDAQAGRPQNKLAFVETRNLPAWTLQRTAVKTDCNAQADSSAAFGFGMTMYDKQRRWPYLSRMTGS
jgi:hypothetical protein